jgi:flagellin-like hook-associated protein FlgL
MVGGTPAESSGNARSAVVVIKFGANILSQTVQRNLGRATLDLSTTSERLASGQRINKASDDAAGLAIAASLNVNARIFTQGVRNLNDGLSAVNIAEGAMGELGGIIVRIEELATQSISETYSDTQRQALQKEATALTAEWNRIVESTSFNGQNLLTGASTRTVLQGGKGTEGTLAVQIGEAQLADGVDGFAGGTVRISTSSSGAEANGNSYATAMSADGRYIVFNSTATNLVTGDTNGVGDVFIKDTAAGTTTRVSTSSSGTQADAFSYARSITADGRYVLFDSAATNLVSGDTNGIRDVFVKDTVTGTTTRVSTNSAGAEIPIGGGYANQGAISDDGRFVAFSAASTATNLVEGDTNNAVDAFIKDRLTGITTRINTSSSGAQAVGGTGFSGITAMSADGRYVAFISDATNLVSGDTNGAEDGFIKDTVTGITTRVTTNSSGAQLTGNSRVTAISKDGRYVGFFSSDPNLAPGDTNGARDAFVKDTQTGIVTAIGVTSTGVAGNAQSAVFAISADGRYVGFDSFASNIVEGDTNGTRDAFIRDTVTGTTTKISTSSSGTEAVGSSYVQAISADGRYAVFQSNAANIVSGDTNGVFDSFVRDLTRTGVQQLSGVVISDKASAKITLDLAQRYRAELLDYRSKIGATTSRISTFVNTLQSSTINYKAASSRITDADIAEEAAKSIASGIRQQVASSLLGQANQAPQIGLQLLRNA